VSAVARVDEFLKFIGFNVSERGLTGKEFPDPNPPERISSEILGKSAKSLPFPPAKCRLQVVALNKTNYVLNPLPDENLSV
jgi:hypothetical protein